MKKLLVYLIISILINTGYSQVNYFNYLDYTSEWSEYNACLDYGTGGWAWFVDNYKLSGDTFINNEWYYKVILHREYNSGYPAPTTSYRAALREDSSQTFWVVWPNQSTEHFLYDFNPSIGDTLSGQSCKLTDIDTLNFNGQLRKVFYFGSTDGLNTLYEGIGSAGGLFGPLCYWITECGYELVCYKKQGVIYQVSHNYSCTLNATTEIYNKNNLSIYPNPTHESVFIENFASFENIIDISVFDITGTRKTIYLKEKKLNTLQIDINNYETGIYILNICTKSSNYTFKLIKN